MRILLRLLDYLRQKQNNEGAKIENAAAQAYVPACAIIPTLRK